MPGIVAGINWRFIEAFVIRQICIDVPVGRRDVDTNPSIALAVLPSAKLTYLNMPFYISESMETEPVRQQIERYLAALEERLEQLIFVCEQLASENQSLLARQNELLAERDELLTQNEQARTRIEAMVSRLKGMGQTT